MTRYLICGLGSIGRRHLRNLQALGESDIVLYRTGRSTLPNDELADFPTASDLAEALESWSPQAVLVTNPTALHMEVALPAARAGAALFIEKPVAHNMEQAEELAALAADRTLVGYHFRFHPTLRLAYQLVQEGAIGQPVSASVCWGEYLPGWHPWEDHRSSYSARADLGGGVILTLSHPFDYLRWILGEVRQVRASVGRVTALGLAVEEAAEITLHHESGCMSQIHLDYLRNPPRHDLEVVGSGGMLRWEAESGLLQQWGADGQLSLERRPDPGFERNTLFLDEIEHFRRLVAGVEAPICSLADGLAALQIALAARRSAADSQVIELATRVEARSQ